MTELTDEALLAALSRDDKQAFRALTERYVHKIWRLSFRMLHDRQDAEEVTQDVFVTVWNNRHNWQEGEARFSTWLYRVAVNRSIDFKRRHKPENVELTEELVESDIPAADSVAESREMHGLLMACLKELPEKQMLAMLYYYYEEMDIGEICSKLGTTEEAARSLLKRARANMKDIIGGKLGSDARLLQGIAPYLRG